MRVSYIMPVWLENPRLLDLTNDAIKSFRKATSDAELIIIDNNSQLSTPAILSEASIFIRNKKNTGFASAVRQGWLLASGDIIATVNNDIRVAPNWLEVCEPILRDPIVGTIHPRMIDYDEPFKYGNTVSYRGKERWCTFSFFVMKKSFIGELAQKEIGTGEPFPGTLDANYKFNSADWDFCHRVRKAGYRQVYTDMTCYQHQHSSTQKLLPEREKIEQENREYFKRKWGEYPEVLFEQEFPEQMKIPYKEGFEL